jgi:hypothetical protein
MDNGQINFMMARIKEYIFQKKGVLVEISAPDTPLQIHLMMSAFATANRYLNEQENDKEREVRGETPDDI